MKPTIKLIQTTFWKISYRLNLGEDYSKKLEKATALTSSVMDATNGRISHFYNDKGDRIRGWHKTIKFNDGLVNPLVKRYS